MAEFWETTFSEKNEMWGMEPCPSALRAKDRFVQRGAKSILVPGFGYGRNAKVFMDAGMEVTGIEISKTAIGLARKHFGPSMAIHEGSVSDMPFDAKVYDGIFCYALIHLLDEAARKKLIEDCYRQLATKGTMYFVTISKRDPRYRSGKEIGADWFETFPGVRLFFYDAETIKKDFGSFGLVESLEIDEPNKHMPAGAQMGFAVAICQKGP